MSSLIQTSLAGVINETSSNRFVQTSTNLSVNGCLVDFNFTVPASYTNKWDFLKDCYLSVLLRLGTDNGGSVNLISDVPVYDLVEYSDYLAGVSLSGTDFTQGKIARISGYLPLGFFVMNSRDALEVSLTVANKAKMPADTNVNFVVSTVYDSIEQNNFILYKSAKPTGADQPYKNVLKLFYSGDTPVNKNITTEDMLGSKSVNIEDAIALSNACGNFEFFTRFGKFYEDEFGLSQDLSFRVPTDDASATCLVIQYGFYPEVVHDNSADTNAQRDALIEKIRVSDSEKYDYLKSIGVIQ